jgi:hypothetical protein
MSSADTESHDYTTGLPRCHHSLYIKDGNLILQVILEQPYITAVIELNRLKVENAIFKVHRSFLEKRSSVIKDMLEVPPPTTSLDGTDEKPLVLSGDSASGWEVLLESLYERSARHPTS